MSQTSERAKTRLRNLTAIEPLLNALKTISMGNWQIALNKVTQIQHYERHYNRILVNVLPVLGDEVIRGTKPGKDHNKVIFLIIGTEHGLCGRFNDILAENAINWVRTQNPPQQYIWVIGTKMLKTLERKGISPDWAHPLPGREVGTYKQAYRMTQDWSTRYEKREFDRLVVLYNQATRGGGNKFATLTLLPFTIQPISAEPMAERKFTPAPIIETDPIGIYRRINQHFLTSSFYQVQLQSMIAESSSRYRIMEEAKRNAGDIMTALAQEIQAERKRQITQEMQELAVSAGLIDNK
ncbi:MAG TPA: hypothetical protein DF984_07765 [Anaerolineaceae bacterium]|nr:hypothetical protein [Anaerolineaceae bacterium]